MFSGNSAPKTLIFIDLKFNLCVNTFVKLFITQIHGPGTKWILKVK